MSLDNVLGVAAAAHGDLLLVAFGIGLSLPLVVWGSGILARLMNRFPSIVWLGGGILGYVAGEMMLRDHAVTAQLGDELCHALRHPVPAVLATALVALGWWFARR
jgi:predicted tellurium resistance membrane protein TerC